MTSFMANKVFTSQDCWQRLHIETHGDIPGFFIVAGGWTQTLATVDEVLTHAIFCAAVCSAVVD